MVALGALNQPLLGAFGGGLLQFGVGWGWHHTLNLRQSGFWCKSGVLGLCREDIGELLEAVFEDVADIALDEELVDERREDPAFGFIEHGIGA